MEAASIGQSAEAEVRPQSDEEAACRDCRTELVGPFCHHCGQRGFLHKSLRQLVREAGRSILNVDRKLGRTLSLLFRNPGMLTNAYIDGQRTRYLSPVLLFLATSALYVLADELIGQRGWNVPLPPDNAGDATKVFEQAGEWMDKVEKRYPFLILPFFLPWCALLLRGTPQGSIFSHLIFLLYQFSACNIIYVPLAALAVAGGADPLMALLLVLMLLHMTVHLKVTYQLTVPGAAWRAFIVFLLGMVTVSGAAALFVVLARSVGNAPF